MKSFIITALVFLAILYNTSSASQVTDTTKIYGVTIDAISTLNATVTSLQNLHYKPTTRIVFDEWQPASGYVNAVNRVHNVSFIMGEILDSYYMSQYNYDQYVSRVNEYLSTLGNSVDIWEIGNEVNGEWCGSIESVTQKIYSAFKIVRSQNKKTEMTLYYNKDCWSNQNNEMFTWVNNSLSPKMRNMLDYVLVSYYEDDCNNLQPDWQTVFDSLHVLFPNSKIGIGECGTRHAALKETYINRYYRMNIKNPAYIGGYFWWYYRQDCVPYTNPLWTVINNAMTGTMFASNENISQGNMSNYPNPFNPVTKIKFYLPSASYTTLTIYDITGRIVSKPIDKNVNEGNYEVLWDGSNFASGVYIYKLENSNYSVVKKMLLVK